MTLFEIACRRHWRLGKNTYEIARHLSQFEWPGHDAHIRQADGWIAESAVYNALHAVQQGEVRHAA